MLFAQLTNRDGLRSIEASLNSQKNKLYHMGIRCGNIARNTIAKANELRSYKIYEELAGNLLLKAKDLYKNDKVLAELDFNNSIYALDSSIIDVSLSLIPWAKWSKLKGAVKLHTLMDLKGNLPSFNIITDGKVYDGVALDIIPLETGSIYVIDRGYIDYKRLNKIENNQSFYITRYQNSLSLRRIYSNKVNQEQNSKNELIVCDQVTSVDSILGKKNYPGKIRRIKYKYRDTNAKTMKTLIFLTNNFDLDAITISRLYKKRWQIELFFRWIKQHLKIKKFYSYNENGIKLQIWTAICTYLLVAIVKKEYKIDHSMYTILQILSINIFERSPINQLFENIDCKNFNDDNDEDTLFLLS